MLWKVQKEGKWVVKYILNLNTNEKDITSLIYQKEIMHFKVVGRKIFLNLCLILKIKRKFSNNKRINIFYFKYILLV